MFHSSGTDLYAHVGPIALVHTQRMTKTYSHIIWNRNFSGKKNKTMVFIYKKVFMVLIPTTHLLEHT